AVLVPTRACGCGSPMMRTLLAATFALGLCALAVPSVDATPPGTGGGVSCTEAVLTNGVVAQCTADGETVGGPVTCGSCYVWSFHMVCQEALSQQAPQAGCVEQV